MIDLSIIIPTRNRHSFLINTTLEILKNLDGIELIISDNSDNPLIYNFKENGSTVKYIYTNELLSVTENFENSIIHSTRKYVIIIGDDDLVLGQVKDVLTLMDQHNIDSLYPWNNGYIAHFIWPGVIEDAGQLWLKNFDNRLKFINQRKAIGDCIKYPGKGPSNLPKIYQGIVSQDLIRRTKAKYGHIFGGVSPDIYSGLLLAKQSKKIATLNTPFIIPGASHLSTAGEGVLKKDRDEDKNHKEHIKRFNGKLEWYRYIPDVYTSHTVWALSMYNAVHVLDIKGSNKYIFFLYIDMILKYPEFYKQIIASLLSTTKIIDIPQKILYGLSALIGYYAPRLIIKIIGKSNPLKKILFSKIEEIRYHVGE